MVRENEIIKKILPVHTINSLVNNELHFELLTGPVFFSSLEKDQKTMLRVKKILLCHHNESTIKKNTHKKNGIKINSLLTVPCYIKGKINHNVEENELVVDFIFSHIQDTYLFIAELLLLDPGSPTEKKINELQNHNYLGVFDLLLSKIIAYCRSNQLSGVYIFAENRSHADLLSNYGFYISRENINPHLRSNSDILMYMPL